MHEPNIRGNAAGQAFKPGVLTGLYQPRIFDEIDDGWIGRKKGRNCGGGSCQAICKVVRGPDAVD
jgi:hypothetical protein